MGRVCPICGKEYSGYPAISRRDNKTEICSDCGTAEAMQDFCQYIVNKTAKNIKGGE